MARQKVRRNSETRCLPRQSSDFLSRHCKLCNHAKRIPYGSCFAFHVHYSDNNIEECGLELDFTMDFEVLGKIDTIELKKGGAEIQVTEENKEEYIK